VVKRLIESRREFAEREEIEWLVSIGHGSKQEKREDLGDQSTMNKIEATADENDSSYKRQWNHHCAQVEMF